MTDSSVKMMRCMVDYGLKLEKTLKELCSLLHPTGAQPEPVGTPGAGPSTTLAPTPSPEFVTPRPEFVTPPATQPDLLLQKPIPEINTEDLASLRNWVEAGPKVQQHRRPEPAIIWLTSQHPDLRAMSISAGRRSARKGRRMNRLANPIALRRKRMNHRSPSTPMTRSIRVPIPPLIRANRKRPRFRLTGPLPDRRPRKGPPAPSARQSGSRSRVVVVELKRGEEVSSA